MRINTEFEGGNIEVLSINSDTVRIAVQLRDTVEDWFYWAFRVCGAQGRTVTFDFTDKAYVGYYGAAVSRGNADWHWSNTANEAFTQFKYAFGADEDVVYFCHDMRYGTRRFFSLADRLGLPVRTLAVSKKGRDIPYVRFGEGNETIMLTARHHACESTGNYVMEGVLEILKRNILPDISVLAVPFVDLDGVVDGDQGKLRSPHDHNRDYAGESIYSSAAAIRKLADTENIIYAFDFHSPWHFGGRNDLCFAVRNREEETDKATIQFNSFFEEETQCNSNAFQYRLGNDLPINCEWNTPSELYTSCVSSFGKRPNNRLAFSLETPYFGKPDNMVSQDRLVALGHCFGRAIIRAINEGI